MVEPVFKVESNSTAGDLVCPYLQWNEENKKLSVEAQREAPKQLKVMKRYCFIADSATSNTQAQTIPG